MTPSTDPFAVLVEDRGDGEVASERRRDAETQRAMEEFARYLEECATLQAAEFAEWVAEMEGRDAD